LFGFFLCLGVGVARQGGSLGWLVIVLRVVGVLTGLLALGQPFLAGGFLQGYYPLLEAHRIAAMILAGAAGVSAVVGVLVWRPGGGPARFAVSYTVLTLVCVAEITLGFERVLLIHVPLGVGIFVMSEKFAVDVFGFKPEAAVVEPVAVGAASGRGA
jgi:hypothetical protein